jgi:hypothetical protein
MFDLYVSIIRILLLDVKEKKSRNLQISPFFGPP